MPELLLAEKMTLTITKAQLARGERPSVNTTTYLVMIIERLAGIADYSKEIAGYLAADGE